MDHPRVLPLIQLAKGMIEGCHLLLASLCLNTHMGVSFLEGSPFPPPPVSWLNKGTKRPPLPGSNIGIGGTCGLALGF